jgi:hypothetical protein
MNFYHSIGLIILVGALTLGSCTQQKRADTTEFTRIDSLTEKYLALQDSMLITWNTMIQDDNYKIKVMNSLLHELKVCGQFDQEVLNSLQHRLDQLTRIRYTPKTMWNVDIIEEYDFASGSLITELITLAETHKGYTYNKALQHMVNEIQAADLRVENYRMDYDATAMRYNHFLEKNKDHLHEIANNGSIANKPLFQMASDNQ